MNLRFFEPTFNNSVTDTFILNLSNSHKIISVLRLQPSTIIHIFNSTNVEFVAKIVSFRANKQAKQTLVEVAILKTITKNLESPLKIHLAQAIVKHDNMDWIIQKSVELGVDQITPVITERTIVKMNPHQITNKILHWQSIASNACCQCGRNIVPKINASVMFDTIISKDANLPSSGNKFIFSPNGQDLICVGVNNFQFNNHKTLDFKDGVIIVIGPEGGFSNKEIELAIRNKFVCVTVGPRILRTETAAIVAISLFQSQYGDLL